jgi:hypothetical protein
MLEDPMFPGTGIEPAMLAQGIAAWTLLLGAVTSEVFSQLGHLPNPPALFEALLAASRTLVVTAARRTSPVTTSPVVRHRRVGLESTTVHRPLHSCVHSVTFL